MKYFFVFVFCFCFSSCSFFNREKDPIDYIDWLNEETNGLVQKKHINGLVFTAKYLPPEYLAYQEVMNEKGCSQQKKDSLIKSYSHTKTFLLSVAPDEENEEGKEIKDVMFLGIKDKEEYKERSMQMNFEMQEYIELNLSDKSIYKPVLTNMENTYGLGNGRSILCVFAPLHDAKEFDKAERMDLVWDDEIFRSGRNHFVFDPKDFSSIPRLKF